jgi:hypothetical protein
MSAFIFIRAHVSLTFIITSKSDEKEHVPKQRHLRQQLYMLEYVFCVDKNKILSIVEGYSAGIIGL